MKPDMPSYEDAFSYYELQTSPFNKPFRDLLNGHISSEEFTSILTNEFNMSLSLAISYIKYASKLN